MRYFNTAFSLTLGGWRLRLRIDLDDDPEDGLAPPVHHVGRRTRESVTSSTSR